VHDVVVIGGGVVGAAAAYRCVQQGARTLLVDAALPGRATDAGAGIVSPETELRDGSPSQVLAEAAARFYPSFVADLQAAGAADTGYANCGKLIVARNDREAEWMGGYLHMLLDPKRPGTVPDGIEEITPSDARARFPLLGDVTRAAWSRAAARVDGRLLTAALVGAAEARGLEMEHATVERVDVDDGAVRAAVVAGTRVGTARVIVAAGAWSSAFAPALRVVIDIRPQRGQIAHFAIDDPASAQWPVVSPLAEHYLLAFPGRVVAGATREDGPGFDVRVTAAGCADVINNALSVAPGLADATLHEMRVGLRPVAVRGYPYLGAVPGVAGAFLATGHGASGLTYGPWSGVQVADAALGLPHDDLTPFAV
jgi:glycine/D-amino acid oxidase-like deaminating enzyme